MATILKRSAGIGIPQECTHGCCTPLHGKHVAQVRRSVKRREKAAFKSSLKKGEVF